MPLGWYPLTVVIRRSTAWENSECCTSPNWSPMVGGWPESPMKSYGAVEVMGVSRASPASSSLPVTHASPCVPLFRTKFARGALPNLADVVSISPFSLITTPVHTSLFAVSLTAAFVAISRTWQVPAAAWAWAWRWARTGWGCGSGSAWACGLGSAWGCESGWAWGWPWASPSGSGWALG